MNIGIFGCGHVASRFAQFANDRTAAAKRDLFSFFGVANERRDLVSRAQ